MEENHIDPTATYLHILQRLREFQARGQKMPSPEASQSFALLMQSCGLLIMENDKLRRTVAISDQIVQELEIEMTLKDIEIFNFTNHSEQKDDNSG